MDSTTIHDWAVTPEKVERAIQKIIAIGKPRKIILFGSFVKGITTANSDLDVLVITGDDTLNPRKESVRIRKALRGISMPMDIIVIPEAKWLQLKDCPGMIFEEALRNGRVVYESEAEVQLDRKPMRANWWTTRLALVIVDDAVYINSQLHSVPRSVPLLQELAPIGEPTADGSPSATLGSHVRPAQRPLRQTVVTTGDGTAFGTGIYALASLTTTKGPAKVACALFPKLRQDGARS